MFGFLSSRRERELTELICNVIREQTDDIYAARLEVGSKIIEALQDKGWRIKPPSRVSRAIFVVLRPILRPLLIETGLLQRLMNWVDPHR